MGTIGNPERVTLSDGREVAPAECYAHLVESFRKRGFEGFENDADWLLATDRPITGVIKALNPKYRLRSAPADLREVVVWALRWRRAQLIALSERSMKAGLN